MDDRPKFVLYGTGGNCTAWRCELPGGYYILVTDNDCSHEFTAEDYVIGLYKSGEDIDDEIAVVYGQPE